uniref:THAP-type domain-containing protein n=1 Tax=Oncorhynchus mykiss TaxID=8022 RepID=A0A8C7TVT9_ONCMY
VLRCSALKHCLLLFTYFFLTLSHAIRFPLSDAKRLKKWIHQTRLKAWKPTKSSRLCSEHFEEKYLITPSTGRGIRLRNDAIPTIFSFPSQFQKKVICELMQVSAVSTRLKKTPSYLNHSIWHPSRFHDDYCIPQIKEKWEWLTMEVKGPFPETQIGHRFVLTVMDYYSKWMEAYPMKTCTSKEIAQIISDLISRFGFPVGILCCLGVMHVFCFIHVLSLYLDRLVSDLVKEHPDRWDVYLAASVFSFCCKEHPTTRQIPLSLLRCGGTQSVSTSPRKLPVSWRLIVFRLTVFKLHLDCVSLIKLQLKCVSE